MAKSTIHGDPERFFLYLKSLIKQADGTDQRSDCVVCAV